MTKTFTRAVSYGLAKPKHPVLIQLGSVEAEPLVWNFEFGYWDLFEIWDLVLGIFLNLAKNCY
jgi:hypothetical protein